MEWKQAGACVMQRKRTQYVLTGMHAVLSVRVPSAAQKLAPKRQSLYVYRCPLVCAVSPPCLEMFLATALSCIMMDKGSSDRPAAATFTSCQKRKTKPGTRSGAERRFQRRRQHAKSASKKRPGSVRSLVLIEGGAWCSSRMLEGFHSRSLDLTLANVQAVHTTFDAP